MGYQQDLLQAIDIISERKLQEAKFDKTIQALVINCEDESLGKYKIKYQDAIFIAYSTNPDITYTSNTSVYVSIPNGDMSKDKTIIGSVDKLGTNYISVFNDTDKYDLIGDNCLNNVGTYGLCSYKGIQTINLSTNLINTIKVNEYIKNASYICLRADFRTSIPVENQAYGNYGIKMVLRFKDVATEAIVEKECILDINKMIGTPYRYVVNTTQSVFYQIDSINFVDIKSISLFAENFILNDNSKPNDIFISNIGIYGASQISEDDLNSFNLSIITPQGTLFTENNNSLVLNAELKVKNKVVNTKSQNVPFYWFVEDLRVTTDSEYYNQYGKKGWKCLNSFTSIGGEPPIKDWTPAENSYIIQKKDVVAKIARYKCVVVYEDNILSKIIEIKNLTAVNDISIIALNGKTEFKNDIGQTTLTCLVNGNQNPNGNFEFLWYEENSSGDMNSLLETNELNINYQNFKTEYDIFYSQLNNGTLLENANQNLKNNYDNQLKTWNTTTRVEKNVIYNIQINTITSFSNFKCAVYRDGTYIGMSSISITNKIGQDDFTIVIENGEQVFKYNEAGIAPTHETAEKPIKLQALTFKMYDSDGNEVSQEILSKCEKKWIIPTEDTLLTIPKSYTPSSVDLINNTATYSNLSSFSYGIADRYNPNYSRNNIQLDIYYKNTRISGFTSFVFIKEGEDGSNGTNFVCKIVPNVTTNKPRYLVLTNLPNGYFTKNYTPAEGGSNAWFHVQLWKDGEKIFDGRQSSGEVGVVWKILKNKYSSVSDGTDSTEIGVVANTGIFSFYGYKGGEQANLVQACVTYEGKEFYAVAPIITIKKEQETINGYDYKIGLKENTGFTSVQYSASGLNPIYDSDNPFELSVEVLSGTNIWDNIINNNNYYITTNWNVCGSTKEKQSGSYAIVKSNLLTLADAKDKNGVSINYKKIARPAQYYDGWCVNNAIECTIVSNNYGAIGSIRIPIYFYLNRFGNENINGWDGNSVQIDEDGGFILAPQIGAGKKDSNNRFTGIIMGEVKKEYNNDTIDETGLFGYNAGQRTLFLNAEDGSAIFGTGGGQIIIDPKQNLAKLYSHNFYKNYGPDGKPTSYGSSNEADTGLLIDLTTPEIRFGNGNFSVDKDGNLIAKGFLTEIAGWHIGEYSLYKNRTGMNSNDSPESNIAFWAGATDPDRAATAKFKVDHTGHLEASDAIITNGGLGRASAKITIGQSSDETPYSAIYSGTKDAINKKTSGFYLGTNGLGLGNTFTFYDSIGDELVYTTASNFQVNSDGKFYARQGRIGSGTFAFEIGNNRIRSLNNMGEGKTSYNDGNYNGIYLSYNGIGLGKGSDDGDKYLECLQDFYDAKKGTYFYVGNKYRDLEAGEDWSIGTNISLYILTDSSEGIYESINFIVKGNLGQSPFWVDSNGNMHAEKGVIGGWTLNNGTFMNGTSVSNSTIYFGKSGFKYGENFSVTSTGNVTIKGKITAGNGSKIGGWTVGENYIKSSDIDGKITLNSDGNISLKTVLEYSGSSKSGTLTLSGTGIIGNNAGVKLSNSQFYASGLAGYIDLGVQNFSGTEFAINTTKGKIKFENSQFFASGDTGTINLGSGGSIKISTAAYNGGHLTYGADGLTLCHATSSSKRYKNHIRNLIQKDVSNVLNLPVVYFMYKDGYLSKDSNLNGIPIPGFYAEDVANYLPEAVIYKNGEIESWDERILIPVMFQLIKNLYEEKEKKGND